MKNNNLNSFHLLHNPAVTYENILENKKKILEENKDRSGIYCFINKLNSQKYVGSSVNLSNRFIFYYSETNMKNRIKKSKSKIYSSILKHGLSKFSLEILEYCEPEKCIEREKFFIDLLQPKYNIIKDPTIPPMFGKNHFAETLRKKLSHARLGEKNPMFGRTGEKNPRFGITGENHPNFGKARPEGAGSPPKKVQVLDKETNKMTYYDSFSDAAKALNINYLVISNYFRQNQQKPYKGRYIFTKID